MNPRVLRLLIASFGLLYVSGLAYWLTKHFLLGSVHLVAAAALIFVSGMIWALHVGASLRLKRNRASGWVFYGLLAALVITGTVQLYGGEEAIHLAAAVHPWLGAALLPSFAYHGWARARARKLARHGWPGLLFPYPRALNRRHP